MDMMNLEMLASDCKLIEKDTNSIDRIKVLDGMRKRIESASKAAATIREFMCKNFDLFNGSTSGGVYAYADDGRSFIEFGNGATRARGYTTELYSGIPLDLTYIAQGNYVPITPSKMSSCEKELREWEKLWFEIVPNIIASHLSRIKNQRIKVNNEVKELVGKESGESSKVRRVVIAVEMV